SDHSPLDQLKQPRLDLRVLGVHNLDLQVCIEHLCNAVGEGDIQPPSSAIDSISLAAPDTALGALQICQQGIAILRFTSEPRLIGLQVLLALRRLTLPPRPPAHPLSHKASTQS